MTAQQKFQILQEVLKRKASVSLVCRQNKISRKTFYQWKKRYLVASPRCKSTSLEKHPLRGLQHPRGKRGLFKNEVLKTIVAHPEWGSHKISEILSSRGKRLGNHGTYTLLKEIGLEKAEKRWEFSGLHRTLRQVRDKFAPGPRRLLNQARKRMAEEVLLTGRGVGEVAEEFKVSRKTVWKWICRYREAQKKQVTLLFALSDQHLRAWVHPRGTPEWLEKKILGVVSEHPEYSVHTLAKFLAGQIGSHGVQNVLLRNDLNTYQKRALYAQSQTPAAAVIRPATGWLNRLKTVFITFLPQVAPAPPPSLGKLVRSLAPPFTFSFLFGFLLFFWAKMLVGQSFSARIGLVFASISLSFGFFFFLYSLKYYFTLILILGFSRQVSGGNENYELGIKNHGENRKGSILERLFGVALNGNGHKNGNGNGNGYGYGQGGVRGGLQPDLSQVKLERHPFVSIHLPLYNEKRVVERLLTACTSQEYPSAGSGQVNYEVVVVDDSTDETTEIAQSFAKRWNQTKPYIKVIHRETREGYKGGALQVALENTDPRAEFVLVFDADFLPYPDTITQFLKYFQVTAGGLDFSSSSSWRETRLAGRPIGSPGDSIASLQNDTKESPIAAIQGYQWHVLNKSENWITRGVRSEYAGSYVVERSGEEALGALKQIAGSVYMIRRDILENYGWGTSITEDFELTLRLYRDGYKVVYTPYIQTPSECVSTLKRLIRQRMRWAEGHSHNIKRMFWQLMRGRWEYQETQTVEDGGLKIGLEDRRLKMENQPSTIHLQTPPSTFHHLSSKTWVPSKLTFMEKLEFLYLSPYYLQATFFMLGTLSWFLSEAVFHTKLPFWTSIWGWSLVFTNLFSLPLMNLVGLFLEESEERDYGGILSFIFLTYILTPFQGYAALKGFLEKQEGPWFRTPKTGKITDAFTPGRFYRFIWGIFGRPATAVAHANSLQMGIIRMNSNNFNSPVLALNTANNRFNSFSIRPKKLRWIGRTVVAMVLVFTILLNAVSFTQNSSAPTTLDPNKLTLNSKKAFQIEGRDTFAQTETPQFHLKIPDNQPQKTSFLKKFFNNEVQAAEPEVKTSLFDSSGVFVEGINTKVSKEESGYKLSLVDNIGLKPGKYTLRAQWSGEDGKTYESSQDFRWGVLAINTNKSMYTLGEVIKFSFGVLDDQGATICDARLSLEITNPSGEKTSLSSQNGLITQNEGCTPKGATRGADYLGQLLVDKLGNYNLHLVADTQNGQRSIDDQIEVKDTIDIPFDIERTSVPTRIYPPTPYPVIITIKANQDFTGTISDQVPASFEITQSNNLAIQQFSNVSAQGDKKIITWDVNWKRGEVHELGYTIKFPRVSPEFYLVGPLRFASLAQGKPIFEEARKWQIAGDVVATKFMESGTDATQGFEFYYQTVGTVTSQATTKHTVPRAIKFDSGAGNAMATLTKLNTVADTGARISVYYYFDQLPEAAAGDHPILSVNNANDSANILHLTLNSSGYLKLKDGNLTQLGSTGTHQISAGTAWYRVGLSYVITSTTVNEFRVFVDGAQDITATNVTIAATGTDHIYTGWNSDSPGPGANKVGYVDDLYIDDGTTYDDPGDIRVTAKLPNSDTNIEWDTVTGSGTNNCVNDTAEYGCVDDRPLSSGTTYISDTTRATGTTPKENFAIEGADTGDVAMSQNTVVARTAWVWAERGGAFGTLAVWMWNNGSAVSTTITTTPAMYTNIVTNSTYPTDTQAVGMTAADSTVDTIMYETGMLIAFIGEPVPEVALLATPLAFWAPKIIKSIQQGTLVKDIRGLFRRFYQTLQKFILKLLGIETRKVNRGLQRKKKRKRKVDI